MDKHGIQGKIPKFQLQECFLTVKDHKEEFPNKIHCRLINPSKSHVARVSKNILDNINKTVRSMTNLTQWRNTKEVLKWLNNIPEKSSKMFIKFDIVNFYPSISKKVLLKAL